MEGLTPDELQAIVRQAVREEMQQQREEGLLLQPKELTSFRWLVKETEGKAEFRKGVARTVLGGSLVAGVLALFGFLGGLLWEYIRGGGGSGSP